MFLDNDNATGVTAESPSPKAAETAENVTAAASASSPESSSETNVSTERRAARTFLIYANEDRAKAVASISVTADTITGAEENLVLLGEDGRAIAVIELQPGFDRREVGMPAESKTTLDANLDKDPVDLAREMANAELLPLQVEDPVKVWADPEHKAFRVGEVVAVHEGGHAFDVKLDDGTVTKVPADGLEYDDRR